LLSWTVQWRLCLSGRFAVPLARWLLARVAGALVGGAVGLAVANAVANLRPGYGSLFLSGAVIGAALYALISSAVGGWYLSRLLSAEARALAAQPVTPAQPFTAYPARRALRATAALLLGAVALAGAIRAFSAPQPALALAFWTPDPDRPVYQAAFRPAQAGAKGSAAEYQVATVSGTDVRLWRVNTISNTATLMSSVGTQGESNRIAFDPSGALLAVADYQGLKLLEIDASGRIVSDKALRSEQINTTSADVVFSPDGKLIGLGYDHIAALVTIDPLTLTRQIVTTPTRVKRLTFDPDRAQIFVRYDNGIGLYDLTGTLVISGVYYGNQDEIAFLPGRAIVLSSGYGLAAVREDGGTAWSVEYERSGPLDRGDAAILTLATSPDGKYIASGTNLGEIWLARGADGARLAVYRGHLGAVNSLEFSPDGRTLLSAGEDRRVLLWKLP
jgi:WD40 repeat protein